jgi:fumarylacetoacetate (FAA) hydrolase
MDPQEQLDLRLATRRNGTRDGELVLVSPSRAQCASAARIAPTLQAALDDWPRLAPALAAMSGRLDAQCWNGTDAFSGRDFMAPLPRAYQWADASVYRNHARLMYQWRREPIPPRYEEEPLVYQGGSDVMLGPHDDLAGFDPAWGVDLEAEIAVIVDDVPMGSSVEQARAHIRLVVLLNDVSLRALIPPELAKGFGFYQSKPSSSFAPIAVTPAALGPAWKEGMLDLPVTIRRNGELMGEPNAAEDTVFNFPQVIAYLARTRALGAGSVIGAGTISNADPGRGSACITEARVRGQLAGRADADLPAYLQPGDRIRIEVFDERGTTVFGAIDQVMTGGPA